MKKKMDSTNYSLSMSFMFTVAQLAIEMERHVITFIILLNVTHIS